MRAFGLLHAESTPCGQSIPVSEAHALGELAQESVLRQVELARRLRLQKSTVSLVGQPTGRGWVERGPAAEDGRGVVLRLTPQGSGLRTPSPMRGGSGFPGCSNRSLLMNERASCTPWESERGRSVMPFDLEETTHHFTPTDTGVQDIVADQPGDAEQIDLIRTHLKQEAEAFRRGDFGDPAQIHGDDTPGLAELEEGYERFEVPYHERTDGATMTYDTGDSALVGALHDWFEAQLSDHADHAETGH